MSNSLLTTWTSWQMASSSLAPWLPWVSVLPAEQQTLDHLDLLANVLQLFSTWLSWVSLLTAEQETLDHLDLLANGLQLFGTLALLDLYLTC